MGVHLAVLFTWLATVGKWESLVSIANLHYKWPVNIISAQSLLSLDSIGRLSVQSALLGPTHLLIWQFIADTNTKVVPEIIQWFRPVVVVVNA